MTILVIVESPAKCAKIQEYLGSNYKVLSSMGHIRALKQDLDAVGINTDWTPQYELIKTKSSTIKQLKDAASKAEQVILATDDDREGEGIAYHICAVLKLDPTKTKRIVFHSITKQAIQDALNTDKTVDMNKFQSQQTRAMLDMLIGYTLSPVLWAQLNSNGLPLSAGRCQTPALKLVLDRDTEIDNHTAQKFWTLTGMFVALNAPETEAHRAKMDNEEQLTQYIRSATQTNKASVQSVKHTVKTSNPPKPLITSTLQQEASKSHNMNPKATMAAAQKLYEAGHITYMRTDNAFLSNEGALAIRSLIEKKYGPLFLGPFLQESEPKVKTESKAKTKTESKAKPKELAHEAIRPTKPEVESILDLGPAEAKIYHLIWTRAFQSQMAPSTEDARNITFTLDSDYSQVPWISEQTKQKFLGWKTLNTTDKSEQNAKLATALYDAWSKVVAKTVATWLSISAEENFTKSSPRYTEASLIHALEEKGIGRPSTFASLVSTIIDRNYVEKSDSPGTAVNIRKLLYESPGSEPKTQTKQQIIGKDTNKLQTTPLGRTVAEFLYAHYSDIFAYEYTAHMELALDNIALGNGSWKTLLQQLWDSYKVRYESHTTKSNRDNKDNKDSKSNKRLLGDNISVILSRKGPLLLNETTKEFASLPPKTSFETVTLEQAKQAYLSKEGTQVGIYNNKPIIKKKGPYGLYAECDSVKVPYASEDTEETLIKKLESKHVSGYSRKTGIYMIKEGPYGPYFFKHALKKPKFIKLSLDKDTVTEEELTKLYKK